MGGFLCRWGWLPVPRAWANEVWWPAQAVSHGSLSRWGLQCWSPQVLKRAFEGGWLALGSRRWECRLLG